MNWGLRLSWEDLWSRSGQFWIVADAKYLFRASLLFKFPLSTCIGSENPFVFQVVMGLKERRRRDKRSNLHVHISLWTWNSNISSKFMTLHLELGFLEPLINLKFMISNVIMMSRYRSYAFKKLYIGMWNFQKWSSRNRMTVSTSPPKTHRFIWHVLRTAPLCTQMPWCH